MTTLKFQCGCKHDLEPLDTEDVQWWKENGIDTQGFVICPVHKMRREGWKSLPEVGGGKTASNYMYAQYTPLQLEQYLVWGKPLPAPTLEIDVEHVLDRRDNRDPQLIGNEIRSKRKRNGRAKVAQ